MSNWKQHPDPKYKNVKVSPCGEYYLITSTINQYKGLSYLTCVNYIALSPYVEREEVIKFYHFLKKYGVKISFVQYKTICKFIQDNKLDGYTFDEILTLHKLEKGY
jgi:molybdenum cofactor biosynthesis enzyme MoaA